MIRATLTWLALSAAPAKDFTPERVVEGISIAARPVEGSSYTELQFVVDVDAEVTTLCARLYGDGRLRTGEPYVLKREVLRAGPSERVTWELIAPPMVSKRDMVVRTWRQDSARGCRIDFEAVDAPPHADEDAVRVAALRGSFLVSPGPGGKLHVEHRIHFDPGGLLSPFVVEPGRRTVGVAWLRRLVRGD